MSAQGSPAGMWQILPHLSTTSQWTEQLLQHSWESWLAQNRGTTSRPCPQPLARGQPNTIHTSLNAWECTPCKKQEQLHNEMINIVGECWSLLYLPDTPPPPSLKNNSSLKRYVPINPWCHSESSVFIFFYLSNYWAKRIEILRNE